MEQCAQLAHQTCTPCIVCLLQGQNKSEQPHVPLTQETFTKYSAFPGPKKQTQLQINKMNNELFSPLVLVCFRMHQQSAGYITKINWKVYVNHRIPVT